MNHPLHESFGLIIDNVLNGIKGIDTIKDPACGGKHNVPLFCSEGKKSNKSEYCNVDCLILKDKKISVIIEIEEADIKPTQLCGKFMTSALSNRYIYRKDEHGMAEDVLFVQIVDKSNLKKASSKDGQWKKLEKSIKDVIPLKGSCINKYVLISIDTASITNKDLQCVCDHLMKP